MPHKLVVVRQPANEFYKDEGGKSNMLHFTVKSPVPLDQAVTLKCSLYYESDQRVEDKEQSILVLCKSEYTPYTLSPGKLEETIDFRIEKVSRRKDGQRFKVFVEPDYSGAKPKVQLLGVLSEPINVMSKRKTGERIVSRRAPPRAALPGFPGLAALPVPSGLDLSAGASATGLLSSSSVPFTFPPELAGALPAAGAAVSNAAATVNVTDGSDPISMKLVLLAGQMGQVQELLVRLEKRARIQDKRLARLEQRLGVSGPLSQSAEHSMVGAGAIPMAVGAHAGAGATAAGSAAVPSYPIPLAHGWSSDSMMLGGHGLAGHGLPVPMGMSHVREISSDTGSNGSGQSTSGAAGTSGDGAGAGAAQRPGKRSAAAAGMGTRSGKAGDHADADGKGGEAGTKGGAAPNGSMQFAISLVNADGSGAPLGGQGGTGPAGAPILLQAPSGQGGMPPAFVRLPQSVGGPLGMGTATGGFPADGLPLGGPSASGPQAVPSGPQGMQRGLGPAYTMGLGMSSGPMGPFGSGSVLPGSGPLQGGFSGPMVGLPVSMSGLQQLLPGVSGYRKVRTTEMEIQYRDADIMGAGLMGSVVSGPMPQDLGMRAGSGVGHDDHHGMDGVTDGSPASSLGSSALGGPGSASGAAHGGHGGVDSMMSGVPQLQGPDASAQAGAQHGSERSAGTAGRGEPTSKRARVVLQEAEGHDGRSVLLDARTNDPSFAALAATHAQLGSAAGRR